MTSNEEYLAAELAKTRNALSDLEREYAEYCYVVSHDFNAPFRHIDGFSKLIMDRHGASFDEKTRQHFNYIQKAAEQCQAMITSLLAFSRLNTLAALFEPVDCQQLLKGVCERVAMKHPYQEPEIIYKDLPSIEGDKRQLEQLFTQLLENAVAFQPPGQQPKISIEATQQKDAWQFIVRDNGIGIEPKMQDKIFMPLRRAVDADSYKGQGMGLALAQKIVKRHGGTIWVESTPGEGSSFFFTLVPQSAEGATSPATRAGMSA